MNTTSFDIWPVSELEFAVDTEYKFSVLLHPIHMAMGTDGANDHLAKEAIGILADWALYKLFVACAKVLWWTAGTVVKRAFERLSEGRRNG